MQPTLPNAPSELLIRSDNGPLRRRFAWILVLHGVLVAILLVLIASVATVDESDIRGTFVWVFVVVLVGEIVQIALQCYIWGGRLAITQPLRLDAQALTASTQQGTIVLPWPAVAGITLRRQLGQPVIVVRINPQAVPGSHGVEGDPAAWPRLVKRGVHLGERGLRPGFETILPAIQHYSQGRVPIG